MSSRIEKVARMTLGMRLREIRKQRHMSQEALGKRSGLSGKFIGEVERGEKSISIDSILKVARALDIPLRSLLDGIGKRTTPDLEQILALLANKPEAAVKRAAAMLKAFFGKGG